jgi:phosphoglycolate phosphatase-like HAD superfamily hydrolase
MSEIPPPLAPLVGALDAPELRALYERAPCVFFDCDGVIFDSNGFKIEAMRRTLADHTAAEVEQMEAFWRSNGGASRFVKFEHFYTSIAPRPDVERALQDAAARFGQLSLTAYADARPIPAALELARATGVERCHVVSGAAQVELESVFASKGIAPLFASILGSPRAKLDLVRGVLAERGCPASEALLIGDGAMDFRVCQELGMQFIYLAELSEWQGAARALARAPRVAVAPRWRDLSRALLG